MKTQKDLKREYKEMEIPAGVYRIKNLKNGKVFVSSSMNIKKAWNSERFKLKSDFYVNPELHKDWKEFGEENFEFSVLDILETEEGMDERRELKALEELWLNELKPYGEKGYNKEKPQR